MLIENTLRPFVLIHRKNSGRTSVEYGSFLVSLCDFFLFVLPTFNLVKSTLKLVKSILKLEKPTLK